MIALLREVADPGTGEGARWAGMRTHSIRTDKLAELGASSKLNAEWEFVTMLSATAPMHSSLLMATTLAGVPPPTSMCYWQSAEP
jgi:NTE family protein